MASSSRSTIARGIAVGATIGGVVATLPFFGVRPDERLVWLFVPGVIAMLGWARVCGLSWPVALLCAALAIAAVLAAGMLAFGALFIVACEQGCM